MGRLYFFLCLLVLIFGIGLANPISPKKRSQSNNWDEYQIAAFIGKPIQPVGLIIDISTSDIWFYSDDCKNCPAPTRKQISSKSLNKTANDDSFKIDFTTLDNDKSGSIEGSISSDYMLLVIEYHTLDETKQHSFGLVTNMKGADETTDSYGQKYNGRIGLGLDSKSKTSTIDLFFGKYDKLLCLIQIGEFVNKLTLGQKMLDDQIIYNQLVTTFVPSSNNGLWIVQLDGYNFGKYAGYDDYRAQLSTTTSYIGVFSNLYYQIIDLLSAYEEGDELYVDCEQQTKAPNFEFEISGVTFAISPSDYIVDGPNDQECILKIRQTNDDDYFVLGLPFLDTISFCLDYDAKAVNFLKATGVKHN